MTPAEPHGPLGLSEHPDEVRRWTDAEVGLAIHRAVKDERERCAALVADLREGIPENDLDEGWNEAIGHAVRCIRENHAP